MKQVDVVIIGASLAGAACARELTRRGIDAVAFERDPFPREKVCGGFLSPGAIDLLDELEVLGAVRDAGATAVRSARIRMQQREFHEALPRPGLGISRKALDALLADHPAVQRGAVRSVQRTEDGFRVQLENGDLSAKAVVDAAGKLSRFSSRRPVPQFGVQYYEQGSRGDVLDFWFFNKGYGGAVTVEAGRTNACFLIYKDALSRYLEEGGMTNPLVTGPLAYERAPSDFIAVGDAAGMVDPFCGEGMRHALDTGICAAKIVAEGFQNGQAYDTMRERYEQESRDRWRSKRRLGKLFREALKHPRLSAAGFRLNPEYWLRKLWD